MVHIGTIEDEFEGEKKKNNRIRIGWEIPGETIEIEGEEVVRRVYQNFTLSMHEKATLRKLLDAWRGVAFSAEEAAKFDVTKLLGVPCMLSLGLNKKKTYNTILSAAAMPKGIEAAAQVNPCMELNYQNINQEDWAKLPEFVRKDMATTPEFEASGFVPEVIEKEEAAAPVNETEPPSKSVSGDDLPF
jgi:hypothetical protein